jgi:hypothetical protein
VGMNTAGKVLAGLALVGVGGVAGVALRSSDNNASVLKSDSVPQTTHSAPVGDRDCGDFSTHDEAQVFFDSQGPGDPHKLDRDGDGVACETLP